MKKYDRSIPFSEKDYITLKLSELRAVAFAHLAKNSICDLVDMAYQKLISLNVTRRLSLYLSLPRMLQLYTQLQIHTSWPSTSQLLFWIVFFFGNSLSEFGLTHQDICLWLLLLSKFRVLRSQKHQLLRLYRVSPLWRQGFKRDNQMGISSQVKSTLSKFSEGEDHDCDSFMSEVSVLYKSCVSHLAKWTTLFAEFKCFD